MLYVARTRTRTWERFVGTSCNEDNLGMCARVHKQISRIVRKGFVLYILNNFFFFFKVNWLRL